MTRRFMNLLLVAMLTFCTQGRLRAQMTAVTDQTSTPIPGVGHGYIQGLEETVNPANGSVSLRLKVPMQPGRGLSVPFSFAYDSNGAHFLTGGSAGGSTWTTNKTGLARGGWSYSLPVLSFNTGTVLVDGKYTCSYHNSYIFQDAQGTRHQFQLLEYGPGTNCPSSDTTTKYDGAYQAVATYSGAQINDADGTVYTFVTGACGSFLPTQIEDRNGNIVTFTSPCPGGAPGAFTMADTLGNSQTRTALASSGFGTTGNTISVSGLANPYTVTWGTTTSAFTVDWAPELVSPNCPNDPILPENETDPVITQIMLPDGISSYQLTYYPDSGLLKKITYPSGATITYAWALFGLGQNSNTSNATLPDGHGGSCFYRYDSYALQSRTVTFDGSTTALEQDFTYATNWPAQTSTGWTTKSTTVTTHDWLAEGGEQTYTTTYSYSSILQLTPPLVPDTFAAQIPVEQSISYQDSNGALLEVANESWNDLYTLSGKSTTLYDPATGANQTSQTIYSYTPSRDQLKEQDDYDFGNTTTPIRKTLWQYQGFPPVPIFSNPSAGSTIIDRPCKVVVQDGNGIPYAETDYLYDNQTTLCGTGTPPPPVVSSASTPTGTHDETNYGSTSSASRGNATSVTRKCLSGCTTDATTTYTYDEAGQVTSVTDPCGNASCSDMGSTQTNHKTTYDYTDKPTNGNSAGNSDAFVTTITHPNTGVTHIDTYQYNYAAGELSQTTDENGKTTTYSYADPFLRLTDIMAPPSAQNGGAVPHTNIRYVDTYPPSVTTTNPLGISTKAVYDGMGHQTHSYEPADTPTQFVDMTYNGMGLLKSTTNPYRTGDTIATTLYTYDALGRKLIQTQPDGNTQQWHYGVDTSTSGSAVTFIDEVLNRWQRTSDGLGRLTKVLEPSSTSPAPTLETDYTYDPLGNLLTVNQNGVSGEVARKRSFSYDSLSRLVCASNPETEPTYAACPTITTGTLSYNYDANGNVSSKTYTGGTVGTSTYQNLTTTYSNYDGLNRVGLKSYSDVTPSVSYAYDASALQGAGNLSGRLAQVTTAAGSSVLYNYSSAGYDELGRSTGYTECKGASNCGTASTYQQAGYAYDLAGNPTQVASGASYSGVLEASQRNFTYNSASYNGASTLSMVTSGVQGGAATTLFTSPTYNASGMLTAANLAVDPQSQQPKIGLTRSFDSRLRPILESDTHLPAGSSQPATVTVTVSGTEQSIGGTGTASPATGTISLSYTAPQVKRAIPLFVGSSITLPNGYRTSFVAPSNSAVGVANALAAALNVASSPVTAVVASGGTTSAASVTLTTKTTGAGQNGPIKLTLVSQVKAAPASMSGGGGTTYDIGTVTVSFNGASLTTAYGQTSTPGSVAAGLAAAINGAGLGFTATTASGALTVTANQPGPQYNGLPLSIASATVEPSLFSAPSFTGTSGTFAGGQDSTIYSYSIPSPGTATTGYAANGNLLSYTDTLNGTADAWNFTANGSPCYQPLNRITCANATAGPWGPVGSQPGLSLSWAYDSFGNRTTQTVSGSPSLPAPQTESAQYTTSNNHVTFATNAPNGFSYDNAGNVTDDGINQYAYDGEGRLCAVLNKVTQNKMGYAYDGLGNRVAKGSIGTFSCNMSPSGGNGFTATANFIVGQGGEQLDELDGQGNGLHSNVYANGQLLATYVFSQSDWMYAFSDWLGTKRVTTDASGATTQTCQSLPFGDGLNCSGGIDPSEHHFTGKEHDTESGNDYFGARYYASVTGRFISPDYQSVDDDDVPDALLNGSLTNPQTLNLYSYTQNNPLSRRDYDGHATWGRCLSGDGTRCFFGDYNGERNCQFSSGCLFWNSSGGANGKGEWQGTDPTATPDPSLSDLPGMAFTGLTRVMLGDSYGFQQMGYAYARAFAAPFGAGALVPKPAGTPLGRPAIVPKGWGQKPNPDGKGGETYFDPANPHNRVRVMPGDPNSPNPAQREPYMKVQVSGRFIDASGNQVGGKDPEAHIPFDTPMESPFIP